MPSTIVASGETAANESAKEQAAENEKLVTADIEHKARFRTPGFQRMRTDWNSDDRLVLLRVQEVVDDRILAHFASAYQVMNDVYDLVRTPRMDGNGVIERDRFGFPLWKQTPSGSYEEDWSKLTRAERENFLFTLTSRLFEWELAAADAWGEAMLAKAQWEERYALGYEAPLSGTMGDREASGRKEAADERYFAIFVSLFSKKADAVVRSMNLLSQRLRDSIVG